MFTASVLVVRDGNPHYCGNHARPSEPQYPLWMDTGLRARSPEYTGVESKPEGHTPLPQHDPDFATFTFRDIEVRSRIPGAGIAP